MRVIGRDGLSVSYVVEQIEQYPKDAFPAERVYEAAPESKLRLITCGGNFDRQAKSYDDNIIVFASLLS